ncbi:hypothetical protein K1T71_005665 [Dendrolimus kikuchii]|uniref:Uncharacterized protein n=1 Tax=Dendrolimus kikuchii TaxID=765133 RepID=A0ACC1D4U8_9NEOP|nr:hypothetical protein K1T71_005665 [Dendrolimus kikuchii]
MTPKIKYTKLFIDNEWLNSKSGKTFETRSPADGSVIAKVAEEWRLMDASERGAIINKFANLIERDREYLSYFFIHSWLLNKDSFFSITDGDFFTYTLKQPVGVCGLILPWNVPIIMFISKVCTALAAGSYCFELLGCTVIVKPAEQTPLTALILASLLAEAGLPKGVINVVNGFGESAGVSLTHHPDIAMISFTGSVKVGKLIQQAAGARNLKRVTLELGGKSPLVIMNDADLNLAVPFANFGVFVNQGQACLAASRLYVQSGIYEKFVEEAVKHAKNLKIGRPEDPNTQHGPQVGEVMMNKVLGYIEKGKKEGAKLMTGGKRIGDTGYYIEPTVFADVTDDMIIAKDEIFGPVQCILKFETLDEVLERANNTEFGLAAGIFTKDLTTALQFSKHVEAGNVWINTYLPFAPQAPFGGFKDSGIGRENGLRCLEEYLEVKTVTIAQPKNF